MISRLSICLFALIFSKLAKAEEFLASPNILLSETTTFTLSGPSLNWPTWPTIAPLFLQPVKREPLLQVADNQSKFTYQLGAVQLGLHQLPATRVGSQESSPHLIRVYPNELLQKGEFLLNGQKIPFYSALLIANPEPFPGQIVTVEAKVFLPAELEVIDPAYPDFSKKNLAADVFEPRQGTGELSVEGRKFIAYSFTSRLSLLQNGDAQLGPGKIAPLVNLRTFDRGLSRWQKVRLELALPKVTLQAKNLPEPKPADFSGAIGRFTMSASSSQNEVSLNEPIQITLTLSGLGANAQTPAPTLSAPEGWQISSPTHNAQLSNASQTVFTRILRPHEPHKTIPPFIFTYYDPTLASYESTQSEPIPITVTAAKTESILSGFSTSDAPLPRPWPQWTFFLWQIIPAGIFIYLLCKKRGETKKHLSPQSATWQDDFAILAEKKELSAPEFYRALGRFLEKNPLPDEELQNAWLKKRDLLCYQAGAETSDREPEANRILQKIKNLLALLVFALVLAPQTAESAVDHAALQKSYQAAPASSAREHNLAICAYHLGQPGLAAWHFRRSDLPESQADLALIEKEMGALVARQATALEFVAHWPRWVYGQLIFVGFWILAFTFLAPPKKKKSLIAFSLSFIAAATLAYWKYPRDISFQPLSELATILETSDLRTAPVKSAAPFREVPAASLAKIIQLESDWAYVEFPGQTRAWMPSSQVKVHRD